MLSNRFFSLCSLLLIQLAFLATVDAQTYIEQKIDGVTLKVFQYTVGDTHEDIKIMLSDVQTPASLNQILLQNNAILGVNGVFFCPSDYDECGDVSFTINERYVDGKKIGPYDDTGARVVYGWDKNGTPLLYQTNNINAGSEDEIYAGFANHPLLLKDGQNMLEWYYDQGLIDKKMRSKAPKNFICNDKSKQYIYFGYAYSPDMDGLVQILSKFGCYDAINLDAGKSASMSYNGKTFFTGERLILDGVGISRNDIDIQKLEKKIEYAYSLLHDKLSGIKKKKYQLSSLKNLDALMTKFRKKVYEQYSSDIFDSQGGKVGYSIHIDDSSLLSKLYFINRLQELIQSDIVTLQKFLSQ